MLPSAGVFAGGAAGAVAMARERCGAGGEKAAVQGADVAANLTAADGEKTGADPAAERGNITERGRRAHLSIDSRGRRGRRALAEPRQQRRAACF